MEIHALKKALSLGIVLAAVGLLFWFIPPNFAPISETWPKAHILLTIQILLGAVSATAYGVRSPTSSSSRLEIVAGYFVSVLGGFLGTLIGLFLVISRNREDRIHGAIVLLIAAIITALLLWNIFF